ncbi:RluA family pseudouridine synthase [Pontiellaceae bacterium B12219]|nr:RluA family pseudouridine synthase [Pontiellaceae bacterium B12219]
MQQKKPFKQPPKKFHPKGITILYEDWDMIVVNKSAGMLSVSSDINDGSVHAALCEYVKKGNTKSKNRVLVVHRLEKGMSGLLVFAKTEQAKEFLQEKWPDFKKSCVAVVRGKPPEEKGVITSFLAENSIHLMYSLPEAGSGVFARTSYEVIRTAENFSLLKVNPMTERKNQARVHLADLGCPVAGDKKYGEKVPGVKRLCLHALTVDLVHPFSKEPMMFEAPMPVYFKTVMKS